MCVNKQNKQITMEQNQFETNFGQFGIVSRVTPVELDALVRRKQIHLTRHRLLRPRDRKRKAFGR